MNQLKNQVRLIGNLGMNPEIREITADRKIAKFSVATSESVSDQSGGITKETHWHQVVCWGKQAEFAGKYLEKGKSVALEGKLVYTNYTDKTGVKRKRAEIVAQTIVPLQA